MHKLIKIFLTFSLLLTGGCSKKRERDYTITQNEDLTIVVTSDIHYFSPSLYENYSDFSEAMKNSDGKMVDYDESIVDEFIKEVNDIHPDLVIVAGDLSFNGDEISCKEISSKLQEINSPVAVIPGNHDIDNYLACGYSDDGKIEVDEVDSARFEEIFYDQGYSIALSKDTNSCSYMLSINNKYNMLMIDDSGSKLTGDVFNEGGFINDDSMKWLKKQLEACRKEGKTPLITMHHNLAIHNPTYYEDFTNVNYQELSELFNEYGVPFTLSGHMHLQSIAQINGIYDIASSSLLVNPLQFGIVHLTNNSMDYHTQILDCGLDSYDYYTETFKNRILSMFIDEPDEEFLDYFAKVNAYYFAGRIDEIYNEAIVDPNYLRIKEENKETYVIAYLDSILANNQNCTEIELEIPD